MHCNLDNLQNIANSVRDALYLRDWLSDVSDVLALSCRGSGHVAAWPRGDVTSVSNHVVVLG